MSKPTFFWKARRWWCWWNFDRFILSISESEMKLGFFVIFFEQNTLNDDDDDDDYG